ncbi:MAG: hypothetical protein KGZ75_00820 [Syntrophomonadaceae bacterium]|nr:hypothetical protein [Syntrophomonadaceae bacterium]
MSLSKKLSCFLIPCLILLFAPGCGSKAVTPLKPEAAKEEQAAQRQGTESVINKNQLPKKEDPMPITDQTTNFDGEVSERDLVFKVAYLKESDLGLAGIMLYDPPERIKEVWGIPEKVVPDLDYPNTDIYLYTVEGNTKLSFWVNKEQNYILAIVAEQESAISAKLSEIETPRGLRLGHPVEKLLDMYGPWVDAGDGLLYSTEDMMIGLKIGLTDGHVSRMFLFIGD